MITIIIVVYHSNKEKLKTILKKLGTKYKIIINGQKRSKYQRKRDVNGGSNPPI